MTRPGPDLATLITQLERRTKRRQMTHALIAGTLVLGVSAAAAPYALTLQRGDVVQAPQAVTAPFDVRAFDGVDVEGKAAIVYDLTTGRTLYAKNAHLQLPLASITKLLTTYAAARTLSTSTPVSMGVLSINDSADQGFTPGETFYFEDIAKFTLVGSSNVAAEAISETARVRRNDSTVTLLASAAAAAGLSGTHAVNPSGLDENETESGGYGSAEDVAILAGKLLALAPDIAHATVEPSVSMTSLEGVVHTTRNTNQGIVGVPNALLSKTGFTDLAGGNLVVVFDAAIGHPVAVVVLGSSQKDRFTDVNVLIDRTLQGFATQATATPVIP